MHYAGPGSAVSKLEYATALAGALAYLMIHQQDSVGLVTFDDRVRTLVPAKSRVSHLTRILQVLAESRPGEQTKLAANLHEIAELINRRGMVLIFSDLLDTGSNEAVVDALAHLRYRGQEVVLFHVLAAAEAQFPFQQVARFADPEAGTALVADPAAVRATYLERLRSFRSYFETECARRHIDFVPVDTATPYDRALLAFLQKRTGR